MSMLQVYVIIFIFCKYKCENIIIKYLFGYFHVLTMTLGNEDKRDLKVNSEFVLEGNGHLNIHFLFTSLNSS